MIFSMVTGDMFTFSIIYIIFLFGFTQAFYFTQNTSEDELYQEYHSTWMGLFHMTMGEYSVMMTFHSLTGFSQCCSHNSFSSCAVFNNQIWTIPRNV